MPAHDVARGIAFAVIALTSGIVTFAALVWLPALRADERTSIARVARLVLLTSVAGLAAAALVLAGGDLPPTRGALGWSLAVASFALLALLARRAIRAPEEEPRAPWLWLAPAAALTLVPGVAGHAGGEDPAAVLVAASALHVAAAGVWAGGIACLLLVVPVALAPLPPVARSVRLAELGARFSAVALIAVVVLALSGVIQGLALVGRIEALATTGYGRLVLVKGALLCLLALAGVIHRGRTLPALRDAAAGASPGAAAAAFRRLLTAEAALLALVFVATAALAATPPAAEPRRGSGVRAAGALGALRVDVLARPGRPGDNRLTISLTGGAAVPARLTVTARQRRLGLGPVALRARRVASGRFTVARASLPAPGTWELTLVAPGLPRARLSLTLR